MTTKPAEIIRLIINKKIVEQEHRLGRIGYKLVLRTRLHVYSHIKGIQNDSELYRHLQATGVWRDLGFSKLPDRTQFGRWRKKNWKLFELVFEKVADMLSEILGITEVHFDSSVLEDGRDPDAKWGKNSKGWFLGFKFHNAVNQLGFPMRCKITPGNVHDGPILPILADGLDLVGAIATADSGYDSRHNKEVLRGKGANPCIARNKRRFGKRSRTPIECKLLRYKVEKFHSLAKELMKFGWKRFRGLEAKKGFVYSALLAINVIGLWKIMQGKIEEAQKISVFWY